MQIIKQPPLAFKKGMTLDEYLAEMQTNQPKSSSQEFLEEDLYQTSRLGEPKFSNKLIPYQIRESDQDNYDEDSVISHNVPDEMKSSQKFSSLGKNEVSLTQRNSNKNIINMNAEFKEKLNMRQSKGFRVRNYSNSPYCIKKKQFSPKHNKNLIRSLYNNQWKQYKQQKINTPSIPQGATLYGNFFKGVTQKTNEKYFKKKNSKQIDNLMKYEREVNSKYSVLSQNQFKIEGVSDKLYQRKGKIIK